ncbi:MAG: CD225/dispanin family protein [Prevotella sp.]|nr:CD225/dispanin family protein [Prevotella sp.]
MNNSNTKPENNLVWAIITTILCCLPLGIVSIVYAAKVDGYYNEGKTEAAFEASMKSKRYAKWAIVLGVVVYIINGLIYIFAFT